MIDAWASEPHYRSHIAPVFEGLPPRLRGQWRRHGSGPVIVAGYKDLLAVGTRPVILMEHGAGQTYGLGHPSYAGGRGRESVVLFLCPSQRVAAMNHSRYPDTQIAVIGCPRLDRVAHEGEPGVVGFAWHWNALVVPEARSALSHYASGLGPLAERFRCVGTAHPRIIRYAAKVYADAGIEVVEGDDIFARASVLVVDNSSIGWEFLATDRPVIWANAPWYRTDAHHGLRFWEYADVQVNGDASIPGAVERMLSGDERDVAQRRATAGEVYAFRDGTATEKAVGVLVERFG